MGTCAGTFLLGFIKVLLFLDGHLVSQVRCASLKEVFVEELLEASSEVVLMLAVGGSGGEGAAGGPVLLLAELLRGISRILSAEGFADSGSEKSFIQTFIGWLRFSFICHHVSAEVGFLDDSFKG